MESHRYHFRWSSLGALAGWPAFFVGILAVMIHALAAAGLFPSPLPILDVDRTILLHQAAASERPSQATTLLVGDSSCLMNVSAPLLQQHFGARERVLNLGTISYLDLDAFGLLVSKYAQANPGSLKRVVLFMHPEALRLREHNEYFRNVLISYWNGAETVDTRTAPLVRWSGAEILRTRLFSRWLPNPLPGPWGQFYGFSLDLWDHLDQNQGSAIDPRAFSIAEAKGNPEYRLAPELEKSSDAFRRTIPPGVELLVAITPSPQSFVLPSHDETCSAMLQQWATWLQADRALASLPCSLPDEMFASTTHLNAAGNRAYTRMLARELTSNGTPTRSDP